LAFLLQECAHLAQLLSNLNLPIILNVIVLEVKAMLLTVWELEMQRMQEGSRILVRVATLSEEALLTVEL